MILKKLNDSKFLNSNIFIFSAAVIPKLITAGEVKIKNQNFHYQVSERCGPSLKLIHKYFDFNLPLQVYCLIALETVKKYVSFNYF